VDEPHFNLRIKRPGPISSSGDFERHDAVVNNAVFGRETLEALEANVAHGCEEFAVVLRNIMLSGERSIQAIEGRSVPDDVVGVKVERRFDFINGLTVEVFFHARQVSSNTVVAGCTNISSGSGAGSEPFRLMLPVAFANVRDFIHSTGSDGRALPSPPEIGSLPPPEISGWGTKAPYLAIARPAQRALTIEHGIVPESKPEETRSWWLR